MKKKVLSSLIATILLFTPFITLISAENSNQFHADTGGPYTGIVGIPIQFDGSNSYATNTTITSYKWYCGDGLIETGKITNHTYSHPGVYTLLLTVKDDENNCGTETTQVTIKNDFPPIASFEDPNQKKIYFRNYEIGKTNTSPILIGPNKIIISAEDDIGVKKVEIYVDNKLKCTDDKAPYEWMWKSGHFNHNIKAVVYDTSNQKTTIEQTVFKWKLHPLLLLSTAALLTSQQNNLNVLPDFGSKNNNQRILVSLLQLILNQDNEESQDLFLILEKILSTDQNSFNLATFLNNHPLIRSRIKNNYPLIFRLIPNVKDSETSNNLLFNNENKILRAIIFTLLTSKLKDDTWRLKNEKNHLIEGGSFINWMRDHPFFAITSALLLLRLIQRIRNLNVKESDDAEDIIQNKAPVARCDGPYNSVVGKTVTLSAKNSYDDDGEIVSFNWNFGDGSSGSGETVTHTYATTGEYIIKLTVTDNQGAIANDTTTIKISEYIKEINTNDESENTEFLIIAGGLSAILAAGLGFLYFRRRLFE